MPKKLASDLADRLEAEIRRHPEGVAAGALVRAFEGDASPRSLARLLKRLIRHQRIRVQGRGRTTRYCPVIYGSVAVTEADDTGSATGEVYVPISGESGMLREWVRRPITQRRPVGYDRALLDSYRPNETFYLNDADWRARLREIGRTSFTQRPAGTYARDIMNRLLIDLSWASSRLEGNTYTRLDTLNLIEHSREAEGKDRLETQMILNHKQAIEFLIEQAEDIGFNRFTFMNLHALLSENLLPDPAASGRLRQRIVEISGTVYRPLAVPQQIEEFFRLILDKVNAILDPFEQAFFLMVHIPYLQPFEDVNKRVSRLAVRCPLWTCPSPPTLKAPSSYTSMRAWTCYVTYSFGPISDRAINLRQLPEHYRSRTRSGSSTEQSCPKQSPRSCDQAQRSIPRLFSSSPWVWSPSKTDHAL
jgi:hypothetical protein